MALGWRLRFAKFFEQDKNTTMKFQPLLEDCENQRDERGKPSNSSNRSQRKARGVAEESV